MSPPVRKNLPDQRLILENHDYPVARLHDLPRKRLEHGPRNAGRYAALRRVWSGIGITVRVFKIAFLEQCLRPGLEGRILVWKNIPAIFFDEPNARKVRRSGDRPRFR